jgi:hypothetical protein
MKLLKKFIIFNVFIVVSINIFILLYTNSNTTDRTSQNFCKDTYITDKLLIEPVKDLKIVQLVQLLRSSLFDYPSDVNTSIYISRKGLFSLKTYNFVEKTKQIFKQHDFYHYLYHDNMPIPSLISYKTHTRIQMNYALVYPDGFHYQMTKEAAENQNLFINRCHLPNNVKTIFSQNSLIAKSTHLLFSLNINRSQTVIIPSSVLNNIKIPNNTKYLIEYEDDSDMNNKHRNIQNFLEITSYVQNSLKVTIYFRNNLFFSNLDWLSKISQPLPESFRVLAILAGYNEGDILIQTVNSLLKDGFDIYYIDNWSDDSSISDLKQFIKENKLESKVRFELFPHSKTKFYDWQGILKRKSEISTLENYNWYMHMDIEEIREGFYDMPILKCFYIADLLGYNLLKFKVIPFILEKDGFKGNLKNHNMKQFFEYTKLHNTFSGDMLQLKAWKNLNTSYDLFSSGGHKIIFGKDITNIIFPIPLQLRHYPIRSISHGLKKIFLDRKSRFSPKEISMGWHTQYKHISTNHSFLTNPGKNPDIFYVKHGNFNNSYKSERSSNLFQGDIIQIMEKRPILKFELCQGLNNQRLELINSVIFAYEQNLRYSFPEAKSGYNHNKKNPSNHFLQSTKTFPLDRIYNITLLTHRLSSLIEISHIRRNDARKTKYVNTGLWFNYVENKDIAKLKKNVESKKYSVIFLSACLILTPRDGYFKPSRIELRNYITQSFEFSSNIKNKGEKIIESLPSKYIALHARVEKDWEIYCQTLKNKNCYISPYDMAYYISKHPLVINITNPTVFVASNNVESIEYYFNMFGLKIITKENLLSTYDLLLEEKAAIDQYICEKSYIFFGNAYSSFSFSVRQVRILKHDYALISEYLNHPKKYQKDCKYPCDFEIEQFL